MTAAQIMDVVARRYRIPVGLLASPTKQSTVSHARSVAATLVWECLGYSYPRLGRLLGGKRHTSVMAMLARVRVAERTQPEFAAVMRQIRAELQVMAEQPAPVPQERRYTMPGGAV